MGDMSITIDREFQSLIPSLTAEEYSGLEASIIAEGRARDALVLWGDTLIDGHNRYEICTRHGLPFDTVQMEFDSRDAVRDWIIDNQCSRRNLPTAMQVKLKLMKSAYRVEQAKAAQSTHTEQGYRKSDKAVNINKEIATDIHTSADTVSKVRQIEKHATDEVKQAVYAGEMSINEGYRQTKKTDKQRQIQRAKEKILEQTRSDTKSNAPVLFIGDGIGHVPDEPYDLLFTDPPYSTEVSNIAAFAQSWLYDALSHVKPTGFAYVFIGAYPDEVRAYLDADVPSHMRLEQILVWTYKNTLGNNPKNRYKQNYQNCLFFRGVNAPDLDCPLTNEQWAVQEINAPDGRQGDRYHTWQKPMEIAERFIRHSTSQGMTVFDPFACTGTFLLAAAKLGRKAYGFEINADYANIAFERGCVRGVE